MALNNFDFDNALSGIVGARLQDKSKFIFDKCAPLVPASEMGGTFKVMSKSVAYASDAASRSAAAAAQETSTTLVDVTFTLTEYANVQYVDKIQHGELVPFNVQSLVGGAVAQKTLLKAEQAFAAVAYADDAFSNTPVTGTHWDNSSTGTPIADISDAITSIPDMNRPVLVLAHDVYRAALAHPDISNRLMYAGRIEQGSSKDLAAIFGVDDVIVGSAVVSGSGGYSTVIPAGTALILDCPEENSLHMVQSAMATIAYLPFEGQGSALLMRTFDEPSKRALGIESSVLVDYVVANADLGVKLVGLVSGTI